MAGTILAYAEGSFAHRISSLSTDAPIFTGPFNVRASERTLTPHCVVGEGNLAACL